MKRHDILKSYITTLIAEGHLKGAHSPGEAMFKVLGVLKRDLADVSLDFAELTLAVKGDKFPKPLVDEIGAFLANVRTVGLKGAWEKLREVYEAGVEANANSRRR